MMFSVVDLPQPEGPMMLTKAPSSSVNDTWSRTTRRPPRPSGKRLERSRTTILGGIRTSRLPQLRGGRQHRLHDLRVPGAPAQVAHERLAHGIRRRLAIVLQKLDHGEQHARRAIA